MSKYPYENLSDEDFEDLVVEVSRYLFGEGVTGFAKGRDGGRDAVFEGTANEFPSKSSPWEGRTVIQAKHCNSPVGSFSEKSFSVNKSSTLEEELPRIKRLHDAGELDHYVLFSNRRLTGGADSVIKKRISDYCGLATVDISLIATDRIDREMARHSDIPELLALELRGNTLVITSESLVEIIESLGAALPNIKVNSQDPPVPRTLFRRKNELNDATQHVLERWRRRYLKDEAKIRAFLSNPINTDLRVTYGSIVDELDDNIQVLQSKGMTFEEAYLSVKGVLLDRDPLLRRQAGLVNRLLFYMYWVCDLGRSDEDA